MLRSLVRSGPFASRLHLQWLPFNFSKVENGHSILSTGMKIQRRHWSTGASIRLVHRSRTVPSNSRASPGQPYWFHAAVDGDEGTLEFQHSPRFYFNFQSSNR